MTAQISDIVFYNERKCSIAGINGKGLFNPYEYRLRPVGSCSACWRGFMATYAVKNETFFLDRLDINVYQTERKWFWPFRRNIRLNGVRPVSGGEYNLFDQHYPQLDLKIPFTGGILLGIDFIHDLYVHMGFHPAWKYNEAHELSLKEVILLIRMMYLIKCENSERK